MISRLALRVVSIIGLIFALGVHLSPFANANDAPCDTYQVNGGDEAFLMNLNTPLKFGDIVYNNVYVTPKGTFTFGTGDYTFWDFPQTPSFSVASYDYHAFLPNHPWGTQNTLYVKYGSTSSSICIEWRVLPWGQTTGVPVTIVLRAQVDPTTYEFTPTYQVSSNAPANARYGVRYVQSGAVQPISVQTITPMASPTPIPIPTITQTPTPTPTPSEEITPSPSPSQTIEPTPEPSNTPTETPTPTPTPSPTLEISPEPTPIQTQQPEPVQTQEPESMITPTPEPTIENEEEVDLEEVFTPIFEESTPEPIVVVEEVEENILENEDENVGLLDSTEIVLAVFEDAVAQTFEIASEIAGEVFAIADESVGAFLNIGDDMSPEVREEAQSVVVSAIIITQIASSVSIGTAMRSTGVRIK
jgi:outer membrane biosynthesis protein TonB